MSSIMVFTLMHITHLLPCFPAAKKGFRPGCGRQQLALLHTATRRHVTYTLL